MEKSATYSRLHSSPHWNCQLVLSDQMDGLCCTMHMCLYLIFISTLCAATGLFSNNNTWYFGFALGNIALCDCSSERKFNHTCWANLDATCTLHLYSPLKFDTLQCGRVHEPEAALIKAWPGQHWTLISLLSTLPPSISNKPTHLRIPQAWENIWMADLKNSFAFPVVPPGFLGQVKDLGETQFEI